MGPLRYLVFIAVGLVVASVLFLALSFLVSANFDAGVAYVEGWIVRVTCDPVSYTHLTLPTNREV